MRISLILTVKESMAARLDYLGYKFAKFGPFLTCMDRKKVILYLWTNLIETILVLFCSLFMLVSLYFVHKRTTIQHYFYFLKHVIAFFVINFLRQKHRENFKFLGQNLVALVITNQNLFESKKSSKIKTIKYRATTIIYSPSSAMTLTSREKISGTK